MNPAARQCIYRGARRVAGKHIGVVGLARSGVACVRYLTQQGALVTALDVRPLADLSAEARAAAALAHTVAAPYGALTDLGSLELLVISPGVPADCPLLQDARRLGVPVIGEVELAYRMSEAPLIAVTGTCGKGTTVTTLGCLLAAGGIPHAVAGNIGIPLIGVAAESDALAVVVAEISSFQLETTVDFHPCVSVLLNISEDHLERYDSFAAYVAAKQRLFGNQTADDTAILCTDDPAVCALAGEVPAEVLTVGLRDPRANARLEGDRLVVQLPGDAPATVARRADLQLPGDHHVVNALAACLAARVWGVPVAAMAAALRAYRPAAHLMQLVGEYRGVRYVDDSKATNPASAIADLGGIAGPVIVIAGGKEKDTDFKEFGAVLANKAKQVLLLGECAGRIAGAVGRPELCVPVASLDEAMRRAVAAAVPGDTVVLCPGCSSLDMFVDYAQRGELFAQLAAQYGSQLASQE